MEAVEPRRIHCSHARLSQLQGLEVGGTQYAPNFDQLCSILFLKTRVPTSLEQKKRTEDGSWSPMHQVNK